MADNIRIAAGTRLGPYEIVAPLGAGGMGEVYRARDTRLRRDVALKVLPADLAPDAGRRARFEQEALAAAALNHPNIMGVYDVGSDAGVFYIATELVDGETLSDRLASGPLPVRALLDIAVQIADGMACAHAAQIVHRDLKPANVMIAKDGRVKILDFGLAKQAAPAAGADETVMIDRTEPGMIVGTVNYMSPEQARGKPTDYRSDQFSFGIVLHEMATGKKAFERPESVQTMSAIIAEEPPPIEARIPAPLRWAIDRCLAKDPAARYDSSRDLFRELSNLREHLSEVSTEMARPVEVPQTATRRSRLWLAPAAFVVGALTGLVWLGAMRTDVPDQSSYRFTPFSFEPGGQASPVWSPDGKSIAYSAREAASASYQVFLRHLDSPTPVQLTHGTDDVFPVAWSPDSQRIVLEMSKDASTLWSLAAVGGEFEKLATIPETPTLGRNHVVALSPDNKSIACFMAGADGVQTVWISSPPGSPLVKYAPDPFAAKDIFNSPRLAFSPDGHTLLLFVNAGRSGEEAWLLPYPPVSSSPPQRVPWDLKAFGGTPEVAWLPDSRHIVMSLQSQTAASSQLWVADMRSGSRYAITSGTRGASAPSVSPDGTRLILGERTGNYDVVSVDLATASARRLIETERDEVMPAWAARQQALVYVSDRNGPNEIWLHRPDNPDRPIVTAQDFPQGTTQWFMGPAISPTGDRVIYVRIESGVQAARLYISAVAGGPPIPISNDSSSEFPGSWSPDGSWFAYLALRDGKLNLAKVKTSGQATPVVLKADVKSGDLPSWSPDGQWITNGEQLVSSDGKTTKPIGKHDSPHYVFSADGAQIYGIRGDGERQLLFSIDVATGAEKVIGDVGSAFRPGSNLSPSIRFSLAPDGKSIVYGSGRFKTNLWMLEGFADKRGLLARLGF